MRQLLEILFLWCGTAHSARAVHDELQHVFASSVSDRVNGSTGTHGEVGSGLADGFQLSQRLHVWEVSRTRIVSGLVVMILGLAVCFVASGRFCPGASDTSEIGVTPALDDICQPSPNDVRSTSELTLEVPLGPGELSAAVDQGNHGWHTAVECEAAGLPALSEWKRKLLSALPWEWFDGASTQSSADDDGWERVIFPWTIYNVQEVFKANCVSTCSIRSKIPSRLALGKMYLVHVPGDLASSLALMRVTLVLCVRVFDLSGRVLVRVAVTSPDEHNPWNSEQPEWLGIALEKSEGLLQKAKDIITERANIPVEAVTFSCRNTIWSDPVLDKDLGISRVFCRHFVDARLVEPVPTGLAERLGLDEGRYTVGHWRGCAFTAEYEWWASAKCDSILPAAPPRANRPSVTKSVELVESVVHNKIDGLKPVNPWTIREVAHVLERHRISTAFPDVEGSPRSPSRLQRGAAPQCVSQYLPAELSEARLQAQLKNFELVFIESKSCLDAGKPSLALLRSDGRMFFFPKGSAPACGPRDGKTSKQLLSTIQGAAQKTWLETGSRLRNQPK